MKFWVVAGLMIAGAMLIILPPLLRRGKEQASASRSELNLSIYRDQLRELDAELAAGNLDKEEYQSARSELEGRVLEDSGTTDGAAATSSSGGRQWAIAVVAAVPVMAVFLYFMLGTPAALDGQHNKPAADQTHAATQEQIEAMVASLAKKLETKPDDAEGWVMLGRSYATMRRFGDASAAYARAAALLPNNAQLLADYADVLAMNNGRSMQGEPEKIILQALQADPNNIKALALAGTAAMQRNDYRDAIKWWQRLLALVPPDSQIARSVSASLSQAQGLSGQPLAKQKKPE